jgi:nicotinate-nucleotide adenylyltransferase
MVVTEENPTVIIGGTFDPVHYGHIKIACEIKKLMPQADINFMPVGIPSHRKSTVATAKQRLEMLTLALELEKDFHIDPREITKSTPSYSIESLEEMRLQHPNKPLIWVLGRDVYENLPSWHRATELARFCHLLVIERPGYSEQNDSFKIVDNLGFSRAEDIHELLLQSFGKIKHLSLPMLDISSTQVRKLIALQKSPQLLIADNVRAYIENNKLYQ